MRNTSLIRSLALGAALAVAIPILAKPVAKSLPITRSVKVGQVDVKAGDYRVMIDDNNHLTLLNGKKTIAESNGRWEERDAKSEYTAVVSDGNGRVIELRFAGKKEVFVLSE